VIASDVCKTTAELTEVYTLKRQKLAYFSAIDDFQASQCKNDLAATVNGAKATTAIVEAEAGCATKCGLNTCLCEQDMACTVGLHSCIKYFDCNADSATCVSQKGHYARFDISIDGTDDLAVNLSTLNKVRDFIITFGKSNFCWTETTSLYSIPTNRRNTQGQVFVLNNDKSKAICTDNFLVPPEKWPKDLVNPQASYHESYDADLGQCIDFLTNQIVCGSSCNALCQEGALCQRDADCVGSCNEVDDIDGNPTGEKRCSSAATASLVLALLVVLFALLF
jgi:hypothetical protein